MLLVAAYDTWFDELTVIAATFIGLAGLPWFIELFETIKLPGGVELNLKKIADTLDSDPNEPSIEDQAAFTYFDPRDPNIAMIALRVEIEKKLRLFAEKRGYDSKRRFGIPQLLSELHKDGVLEEKTVSIIRDMLPSLNAAAHGMEFPADTSEWVLLYGPKLLATLDGSSSADAIGKS
jgi:hypothetical protein